MLCEEVTRATPEGAKRFIEPAPSVLSRAKSKQHHMIFGRRGSGKSSLLRKSVADFTVDRRPIAFVDMETFKGHTYPDVLISVLIKSLQEFNKWLVEAATAPASKKSFWLKIFQAKPARAPFNKNKTAELSDALKRLIKDLEDQLREPESSEKQKTKKKSGDQTSELNAEADGGIPGASIKAKANIAVKDSEETEEQAKYVSHKVEYLHQNILRFKEFFLQLSVLSDGAAFLILDDLYHIRRSDQAKDKLRYFFGEVRNPSGLSKENTYKSPR